MNLSIMLILDIVVIVVFAFSLICGALRGFPKQMNKLIILAIPAVAFILFLPKIVTTVMSANITRGQLDKLQGFIGSEITLSGSTFGEVATSLAAGLIGETAEVGTELYNTIVSIGSVFVTVLVYLVGLIVIVIAEIVLSIVFGILRFLLGIKIKKMNRAPLFGLIGGAVKFAIVFVILFMPMYAMLGTYSDLSVLLETEEVEDTEKETVSFIVDDDDEEDPDANYVPFAKQKFDRIKEKVSIEFGSYEDSIVKKLLINPVSNLILKDKNTEMTFDRYFVGNVLAISFEDGKEKCNLFELAHQVAGSKSAISKFNQLTTDKVAYKATFTRASGNDTNNDFFNADSAEDYIKAAFDAQTDPLEDIIFIFNGTDKKWHLGNKELGDGITNANLVSTYHLSNSLAEDELNDEDRLTFSKVNGKLINFAALTDEEYDSLAKIFAEGSPANIFISNAGGVVVTIINNLNNKDKEETEEGKESFGSKVLNNLTDLSKEDWVATVSIVEGFINIVKKYNGSTGTEPNVVIDTTNAIGSLFFDDNAYNLLNEVIQEVAQLKLVEETLPLVFDQANDSLSEIGIVFEDEDTMNSWTKDTWKVNCGKLVEAIGSTKGVLLTSKGKVNMDIINFDNLTGTEEERTIKYDLFNALANSFDLICNTGFFKANETMFNLFNKTLYDALKDTVECKIEYAECHYVKDENGAYVFDDEANTIHTCDCMKHEGCDCMLCQMIDNGWKTELAALLKTAYEALVATSGGNFEVSQITTVVDVANEGIYATKLINTIIETEVGVDANVVLKLAKVAAMADDFAGTSEQINSINEALGSMLDESGHVDADTVSFVNDIANSVLGSAEEVTAEDIENVSSVISDVLEAYTNSGCEDISSFTEENLPSDVKEALEGNDLAGALFDYLFGNGNN